jgi:DNA-binding NarL/FixJ family response regulator
MIRVLVVDDQAVVRDGLVTLLSLAADLEVVGEASDGREAISRAAELSPDVVLMDLRMLGVGGTEATATIMAARPATAVLILTTYADDDSILGALRAGARGYLTKDAGRAELEAAIRSVAKGQSTFAPAVGAKLIDRLTGGLPLAARFPQLTVRELDVLTLVGNGLSNGEIAVQTFISVATVKTHINSIFAKLGARDRAQVIALVRS